MNVLSSPPGYLKPLLLTCLVWISCMAEGHAQLNCQPVGCLVIANNQTILVNHPDYPGCNLSYTYDVLRCEEKVYFKIKYFFVDATDPDCNALVTLLSNDATVWTTIRDLVLWGPRLVAEARFRALSPIDQAVFSCPNAYNVIQFMNAACLGIYRIGSSGTPWWHFNFQSCGEACCIVQTSVCLDANQQLQTTLAIVESDAVPTCSSLTPVVPPNATWWSGCFPICYAP